MRGQRSSSSLPPSTAANALNSREPQKAMTSKLRHMNNIRTARIIRHGVGRCGPARFETGAETGVTRCTTQRHEELERRGVRRVSRETIFRNLLASRRDVAIVISHPSSVCAWGTISPCRCTPRDHNTPRVVSAHD